MNVESYKSTSHTDMFYQSSGSNFERCLNFSSPKYSSNSPTAFEEFKPNPKDQRLNGPIDTSPRTNSFINPEAPITNQVLNNIKFLYDSSTDRNRKRADQMKRLRLTRSHTENSCSIDTDIKQIVIEPLLPDPIVEKQQEELTIPSIPHLNVFNMNDEPNMDEDAEVNVSALDCLVDDDDAKSTSTSNRSFVPIRNNLITKSVIKEDNLTSSYLLALNQCASVEDEDKENVDVLNAPGLVASNNNSEQHKRTHIRLPSGKNYLINSVIEEEQSEMYTDSEMSIRKHSYLFTANKRSKLFGSIHSGNRTASLIESKEQPVERNLERMFFIRMNKDKNNCSPPHVINTENYHPKQHSNSKSEIPSEYNTLASLSINKERKKKKQTAKSDMCNIQFGLERNFDEISKRKIEEMESNRSKVENMKKSLIDKFYKEKEKEQAPTNPSKGENKLNLIMPSFTGNSPSLFRISPSAIGLTKAREQYYLQNSDKKDRNTKQSVIQEQDDAFSKMSTPMKDDLKYSTSFDQLDTLNFNSIIGNKHQRNISANTNNQSLDSKTAYEQMKEKYKKDRRHKSSIFKSDDLRISKTQNINLKSTTPSNVFNVHNHNSISINEQYSFFNMNNNVNICSPVSIKYCRDWGNDDLVDDRNTPNQKLELDYQTDKSKSSVIIPLQVICVKQTEDELCQLNSPYNLHLQLQNRSTYDRINDIKRKLFQTNTNELKDKQKEREERGELAPTKEHEVNNTVSTIKVLAVSNEIAFNVVPTNKIKNLTKVRQSSMEITNTKQPVIARKQILIPSNKHNKTSSMHMGLLSFNNRSAIEKLIQTKQNTTIKNPSSEQKQNGRSNSGSVNKQLGFHPDTTKTISRNKLNTPSTKQGSISKNTTEAFNLGNKVKVLPKKKANTTRTQSQVYINRESPISSFSPAENKLTELLKKLKFPKDNINVDHFKLAASKISNLSKEKHILLIEESKTDKKQEFKGIYEYNNENKSFIKVYGVSYTPSQIYFKNIHTFYTTNLKNEIVSHRGKGEYSPSFVAFSLL